MTETGETMVSLAILLFILLLFYIKFGKKIAGGEKFKKIKKNIAEKLNFQARLPSMWMIFILALAIIFALWAYNGISETPDVTFGPEEILAHKTLGNALVQNGELVCYGLCTFFFPGEQNIGKIKIYPGALNPNEGFEDLSKDLVVESGPYRISFFQSYLICNDEGKKERLLYKAEVKYYGLNDYTCVKGVNDVYVSNDLYRRDPLYIGTPFWRLLSPGGVEDPSVFVGKYQIVRSTVGADSQVIFGRGGVKITHGQKFGRNSKINRIEVIYGSYSWSELLSKIV